MIYLFHNNTLLMYYLLNLKLYTIKQMAYILNVNSLILQDCVYRTPQKGFWSVFENDVVFFLLHIYQRYQDVCDRCLTLDYGL